MKLTVNLVVAEILWFELRYPTIVTSIMVSNVLELGDRTTEAPTSLSVILDAGLVVIL